MIGGLKTSARSKVLESKYSKELTRPGNPCVGYVHHLTVAAQGVHPSYGSLQSILFTRLPENPAPVWGSGINERNWELL